MHDAPRRGLLGCGWPRWRRGHLGDRATSPAQGPLRRRCGPLPCDRDPGHPVDRRGLPARRPCLHRGGGGRTRRTPSPDPEALRHVALPDAEPDWVTALRRGGRLADTSPAPRSTSVRRVAVTTATTCTARAPPAVTRIALSRRPKPRRPARRETCAATPCAGAPGTSSPLDAARRSCQYRWCGWAGGPHDRAVTRPACSEEPPCQPCPRPGRNVLVTCC